MIGDARSNRPDILNLMKTNGYKEIARADLYGENYEDVVIGKSLVGNALFDNQIN